MAIWSNIRAPRSRALITLAALTLTLAACDPAGTDSATPSGGSALTVDEDGVTRFRPLRDGTGLPDPVAELTASDEAALMFMREEERLALDVYTALAEIWGLPIFANIADAEATHTDAVRALLERYDLPDPVPSRDPGEYADPGLQALHDEFLATGSASLEAALRVGATIEELDIADLRARTVVAPDIAQVFANLERGSRNHLRAFVAQLERRGFTYTATYLPQADVDAILGDDIERGGA